MRWSRRVKINLVIAFVVILGFSVSLVGIYRDGQRRQQLANRTSILVDGTRYYLKDNMINILVLGIDLRGEIENENHQLGHNGQSDMMCVVSLDKDTHKVTLLTIPRETMTTIDVSMAKMSGMAETIEAQICLQYGYALSSQMGAELATTCVEHLLGIPIDYYVAISMGGIETLVDDIGGVDVTMSQEYLIPSYLNNPNEPEWITYTQGASVHMTGAEAYEFVHFRDTTRNSTNLERMDRQKDFFRAFVTGAKQSIQSDVTRVIDIAQDLDRYMTTNITTEDYAVLAKEAFAVKLDENTIQRIPGEEVHVELYDEYHVDEASLLEIMLPIYYETLEL